LFSQLLMLRELEIVFWSVLNTEVEIKAVISEFEGEKNAE